MKIKDLLLSLILFNGLINYSYSQEYCEFFKHKNCQLNEIKGFKVSSLSQGHKIKVDQTITYDVVMYGGNEIIIKCCTEDKLYPIRFKLKSSKNGNIIYDNKYNNYLDNLNLLLDHTELISIEISIEPNSKRTRKKYYDKIRVGLAVYIENAFFKPTI